jgi:hypothetical protein
MRRRTLSKQSLRGQVSVKLTPEICINKASSNSRLTAVGRQATAADSHSQNCLQTLLFLSPYLWWENNRTTPACWKSYWNCIAFELGTLCGFLFVLFCAVFIYFISPLWGDNYRTTPEAPSPGLEAEGQTPKLHLNLEIFFTFYFIFFIFIFLYIFLFIYVFFIFIFLFFIFNPFSVSLMPFQLTVE